MLKEFIIASNKVHNNKYDYSLVEYKNNNTKVKIICHTHDVFEQLPKNHTNLSSGCPKCALEYKSKKLRKNKEKLINEFNKIHNNKYDYSLVEYKNNKTKIIVICSEHGEFEVIPSHHLNGIGCSKCSNNYKLNTQEFIEKSKIIHGDKYNYTFVRYKNSKSKVSIKCNKHGIFKQTPYHHLTGSGCPKCNSSSKGENLIRNYLNSENINYIEQKRFDNCRFIKPLPFDFYLPEYNICIEFDGEQHFKPKFGKKSYSDTKRNDKIKDDFCISENIKLIRISYLEMKNINEKLKLKIMT